MNEYKTIKLSEIDSFKNHPYKVENNGELNELVDSIKQNGLLNPLIVRSKDNGRYEMISGHRRKLALELLGEKEVKLNIRYLSDDEATQEFGNPNDLIKQIQQGEYYAFEQDLYENQNSVLKYFAYNYLKNNEIELDEDSLDELDNYVEHLDSNDKLEDIIDYCKFLNNDLEVA